MKMNAKRKRREQDREYMRRDYKERQKEEEKYKRKDKEEWNGIEEMRLREEKRAVKEWRQQKVQERRKEQNIEIAMQKRKCFICRKFEHIIQHYRNKRESKENRKVEVRELEY